MKAIYSIERILNPKICLSAKGVEHYAGKEGHIFQQSAAYTIAMRVNFRDDPREQSQPRGNKDAVRGEKARKLVSPAAYLPTAAGGRLERICD